MPGPTRELYAVSAVGEPQLGSLEERVSRRPAMACVRVNATRCRSAGWAGLFWETRHEVADTKIKDQMGAWRALADGIMPKTAHPIPASSHCPLLQCRVLGGDDGHWAAQCDSCQASRATAGHCAVEPFSPFVDGLHGRGGQCVFFTMAHCMMCSTARSPLWVPAVVRRGPLSC